MFSDCYLDILKASGDTTLSSGQFEFIIRLHQKFSGFVPGLS